MNVLECDRLEGPENCSRLADPAMIAKSKTGSWFARNPDCASEMKTHPALAFLPTIKQDLDCQDVSQALAALVLIVSTPKSIGLKSCMLLILRRL